MKNPDPFARAWRLEKRRKQLGSDHPRCFYCPEENLSCLELDHPVTNDLDPKFRRTVCRNCHRKLELQRDVGRLTHNGHRGVKESRDQRLRRYLRLLADDQESIADVVLSPHAKPEMIAGELRATAASLRRRASKL